MDIVRYTGKRSRYDYPVARKRARTVAIVTTPRARYARGATNVPLPPGFAGRFRRVGNYGRFGTQSRNGTGAEKKFFDTAISFNFDNTMEVPATGQLALIPQGDTESTRDGRKAVVKSIQIRGALTFAPAAAASAGTITYLYLILDTQTNGAAAAITDVFTSNVSHSNMLQLNNSGRFRILKKWVHVYNSGAGVTTAYNIVTKSLEFFKKCNVPLDWNGTAGAITELRSNNIFLMAGSSSDDLVNFDGTCRLRFYG